MTKAVDQEDSFVAACQEESLAFLDQGMYRGWLVKLEQDVSKHRFQHILNVVRTAKYLAKIHQVDVDQCKIAALLHDCAKHKERAYFAKAVGEGLMKEEDWSSSKVFHAELGYYVAQMEYGITDPVILNAIRNHTTGAADMDKVSQVLYLADMVEEGRKLPNLDRLRELAIEDLDVGVYAAISQTLSYLLDNNELIDIRTIETRNALLKKGNMERLEEAKL